MSNLGQKIKKVLTGHHDQDKLYDVKTPDVNAPGAYPSDEPATTHHSDHTGLTKEPQRPSHHDGPDSAVVGVQHHTGHSHHDPEPETKQATSDAGNYPYWGNLPREGGEHVHRSEGPSINALKQRHDADIGSSHAAGVPAVGVITDGARDTGSKKLDHDTKDTMGDNTQPAARRDSKFSDEESNTHKAVAATGVAGTACLVTRDKADTDQTERKSEAPAHTSNTFQHTKTSPTTEKPAEAATPTKTTSSGDNDRHRKEAQAIAAGVAGSSLAGAGYYASQGGDKPRDSTHETSSASGKGSDTKAPEHAATSHHHDPASEAQKATSAAGKYPHWENDNSGAGPDKNTTSVAEAATPTKTTSSGDNDRHRKEVQAIAAGVGGSSLAGAGYLASRKSDDHKDPQDKHLQSPPTDSQTRSRGWEDNTDAQTPASSVYHDAQSDNDKKKDDGHLGSTGLAAAGVGGAGLAGAGYWASNRTDERKDKLPDKTRETSSAIAAPGSLPQCDTTGGLVDPETSGGIHNTVVGAGSSEYSHPVASSSATGAADQTGSSGQTGQPAAQAAAKQAWNKQQPASSNTAGDPTRGGQNTHLKHAAAGAAFGAGAVGLAADYGQGKDHENSPRSARSEKIADRALGSDGKPHAPPATDNTSSGPAASGVSGPVENRMSSGNGPKVLHKCDRCGHDNDISRYFDKDAVFRSQQ